ncbi:transcriptional regulator with XRE-family HTH domain [Pseudomonas nitritireducens]|uniref:Transcriptional regulator with XRE-family HTH domain n=1 Tax=Pseudomonas nitroreducens TaxID=46680 RepID=A0A7W7KF08_PSENT|nr:helix-turn-helix transcriptional regulator [Pseudomonas nitritireducens]MBB4861211.1 transcriptional regulator with XRE-family HTH domain [Pseudomonas nitritireducens]
MALLQGIYPPARIALNVGKRAQELRLRKKLKRDTLAELSGVPPSTIKRFETTGQISFVQMVMIAQALGVGNDLSRLFQTPVTASLDELVDDLPVRGSQ